MRVNLFCLNAVSFVHWYSSIGSTARAAQAEATVVTLEIRFDSRAVYLSIYLSIRIYHLNSKHARFECVNCNCMHEIL